MPEDVETRVQCGAHHEAGHIAIAAAQELRLRPEGIMVDLRGDGLACYYKEPDESAISRGRIIVATLAGFRAEKRFRAESSYAERDEMDVINSDDGRDARTLMTTLPGEYWSNHRKLESRLEDLIEQHWLAIKALARALLAKVPEPLRPLKSGGQWSHDTKARYVLGKEVVTILGEFGIVAVFGPNC
jgi:hypothetical protein